MGKLVSVGISGAFREKGRGHVRCLPYLVVRHHLLSLPVVVLRMELKCGGCCALQGQIVQDFTFCDIRVVLFLWLKKRKRVHKKNKSTKSENINVNT